MTTATTLYDRIHAAAEAVRRRSDLEPEVGLILGTGLGGLAREIAIEADELSEAPVTFRCDPDLLSRVVVNLVGNAFKFTPSGGRVSVGLVSEADRVRITITDNGPGIPPEFRGKVFEKFGQSPLGQRSGSRSSGIGLTFCKLAVEAHGGRIGLESPQSGGARFWVELFRQTAA